MSDTETVIDLSDEEGRSVGGKVMKGNIGRVQTVSSVALGLSLCFTLTKTLHREQRPSRDLKGRNP